VGDDCEQRKSGWLEGLLAGRADPAHADVGPMGEVLPAGYSFHCSRDLGGWVKTEAKREFQARRRGVPLFAEGHLDDPIVIDPKSFAHCILGDLEPAVNVTAPFRFEIEPHIDSQRASV